MKNMLSIFFHYSFQVEAVFQREALRLIMSQLVERIRCFGFKRRNNAVGWADFGNFRDFDI